MAAEAKVRIQGKNREAETEVDPWRKTRFMGFSLGSLSLLSYGTIHHLPTGGTLHSGLGPPTLIMNQGNTSTDWPPGQSDGGIFLNLGSLCQDGPNLCQADGKLSSAQGV